MRSRIFAITLASLLAACGGGDTQAASRDLPFTATPIADLDRPWAMTFLPDGRMLVTEKPGRLVLLSADAKAKTSLKGVPAVAYGGQGGLGDVVLHPQFAVNRLVYLSYAEPGRGGTTGAAVGRGTLGPDGLQNFAVIWRQVPKVTGRGHYGHRLAFGPDGYLYISSGERQKFTPAQDRKANLGKIVRLTDDGGIPPDNPFAREGGVTAQIWTLGHRNPLGLTFAPDGTLWSHEMGPAGGDEVNRILKGRNYGYPVVSDGDHYDGRPIADHVTRPEFAAPLVSWNPVISPAGLVYYTGAIFPAWRGSLLIGGLSSQSLVRVTIEGEGAREADRFPMGARIREVEQGPDGAVYVLEDEDDGSTGRLLRLTPKG